MIKTKFIHLINNRIKYYLIQLLRCIKEVEVVYGVEQF